VRYEPASDTTLAFLRKDAEASAAILETVRVSRVVVGEVLARLDAAESQLAAAREKWMKALDLNTANRERADFAEAQLNARQWGVNVEADTSPPMPPYGSPERVAHDRDRSTSTSSPDPTDNSQATLDPVIDEDQTDGPHR
jgi:hypothetical protein